MYLIGQLLFFSTSLDKQFLLPIYLLNPISNKLNYWAEASLEGDKGGPGIWEIRKEINRQSITTSPGPWIQNLLGFGACDLHTSKLKN